MTATRRTRLVDCNPRWVSSNGIDCAVRFDCPEGHDDCVHVIPFTPALDGSDGAIAFHGAGGGITWQRTGDTFETLTLSPSILRHQRYANRDAAIAAGCIPEYITDTLFCAMHIFVRDGQIEFCGDSR